jgi:CBS domain-containing protein
VVEEGKLVGILTERDIFRLILSQQSLLLEAVSESMPAATRDQLRGIVGHFGPEKLP